MILANGTIVATVRPNFPWNVVHTETRNNRRIWRTDRPVPLNYSTPMDWHHMVPWNALRDGWSALASSGRWETITPWLVLLGVDDVATRVDEMTNNNLAMPHTQAIWEKLCWAKWNLVEGPNNTYRTDDPGGDAVDSFGGINMTSSLRARSAAASSVYNKIGNWLPTLATLTADDTKNLKKEFADLKTYKNTPIHMFDAKTWVLEDEGRIDRFGLAINNRHPTWKKNV